MIPHLVKKTFEKSIHYYPEVRDKKEVMTKKSAVVRFPRLSDPMLGIHRNKETFSVDLLENNHAGNKR